MGATWKFADRWSAVANIGRGFRAPELFELYVNGVHGGVAAQQRGDASLDEEISLNTDLGLRFSSDRFRFKATIYRNQIDDYIFLANTGETNAGGLPIFATDQDDATLTGGDMTLRWFATERFELRATAETVSGDFDATGEDLPLLPADQAGLGGIYTMDSMGAFANLYARADVRYAARQGLGRPTRTVLPVRQHTPSAPPRRIPTRCSIWAWASTWIWAATERSTSMPASTTSSTRTTATFSTPTKAMPSAPAATTT